MSTEVSSEADRQVGSPRENGAQVPSWETRFGIASWVEPFYRQRLSPLLPTAAFVLAVYAVSRLIILVSDLFAAHQNYSGHIAWPLGDWDSLWYLRVAEHWYPAHPEMAHGHLAYGEAGFEPFFPLLIRIGMVLTLTPLQSALFVSVLGGAAATLLVWRLGAALVDEEVGRIGAVLFAVFPGMGIAWGLMYSESVGLALAAACLLAMVRKRWILVGVFGCLATATSPLALALTVPALVEGGYALYRRRALAPLGSAVMIPSGFVAYALYLSIHYHDTLFWWHLQRQAWGARIDFGRSLLGLLWHPLTGGYQGKGWMEWIGVVTVIVLVGAVVKSRLPSPVPVYCVTVFAILFVSNSAGFKPRFLTWAFPSLIALAAVTRRRNWQIVAVLFAGLLPFVFLFYTLSTVYAVQP